MSCLINATIASDFAMLMPIPIAALSALFGIIATSLFADPIVNLSSGNGSAIMFGEEDLTDTTLDLGTAVYTMSVPALRAAIDASKGAPWYILLPPATRTIPLSPFLEDVRRGTTRSFTSLEDTVVISGNF